MTGPRPSGLNWRVISATKRRELDQAWRVASSMVGDRALVVDMTFVTGAGRDGRSLLARWYAEGAQLIARSKVSRDAGRGDCRSASTRVRFRQQCRRSADWLPFHTSFGGAKLKLTLLAATMLLPVRVHAADLKAETVAAWDDYIRSVSVALRVGPDQAAVSCGPTKSLNESRKFITARSWSLRPAAKFAKSARRVDSSLDRRSISPERQA